MALWIVDSTSTAAVHAKLSAHFAHCGVPDTLHTNNTSQFESEKSATFEKCWNFQQTNTNVFAPSRTQHNLRLLSAVAADGANVCEVVS